MQWDGRGIRLVGGKLVSVPLWRDSLRARVVSAGNTLLKQVEEFSGEDGFARPEVVPRALMLGVSRDPEANTPTDQMPLNVVGHKVRRITSQPPPLLTKALLFHAPHFDGALCYNGLDLVTFLSSCSPSRVIPSGSQSSRCISSVPSLSARVCIFSFSRSQAA